MLQFDMTWHEMTECFSFCTKGREGGWGAEGQFGAFKSRPSILCTIERGWVAGLWGLELCVDGWVFFFLTTCKPAFSKTQRKPRYSSLALYLPPKRKLNHELHGCIGFNLNEFWSVRERSGLSRRFPNNRIYNGKINMKLGAGVTLESVT